jgi:protein CpxP
MNDVTANQPKSSRRRWLTGVTVGTLLAGIAVWGSNAWVPGERGFCRAGWHGHPGGPGMFHGPEAMEERIGFMVERVFKRAGASEEQKARAQEIVRALGEDLKPLAGARREGHEVMLDFLTAETIDRARLEQQRAKMIADAQTVSERVTRALADLAEVLTPEQRRTVAESLRRLHDVRDEWMKDS